MSRRAIRFGLVAAGLLLGSTGDAGACPVCFDGEEASRTAYAIGTVLLTFLPLALMGAAALWLRRRWRERERIGEAAFLDGNGEALSPTEGLRGPVS